MREPRSILFVCLGNIIRSPLAEHLFRDLVHRRNAEGRYRIKSAGTSAWHLGEPPDARMVRTAAAHGLQYTGRARQIAKEDFERFDLLIAMDEENRADLLAMAPAAYDGRKIRLLREFDPLSPSGAGVPDPYYASGDGFERTFRIIDRSVEGLYQALESGEL